MRRILLAADRHFFAPASLRDLGIVRITLVATQLMYLGFGAAMLIGAPGSLLRIQLGLARAAPESFLPLPALKILMLPLGGWGARPEPAFLTLVWVLALIAGVAALVGVLSRLGLFVLALTSTLLVAHGYSYREMHHPEALLIIMLWVLAAGPVSGRSIDSLRARSRRAAGTLPLQPSTAVEDLSPFARWPMRVGQWLLALAYLSAAWYKLSNGGLDWFNGYTLSYYMLMDGTRYDMALGLWLAGHPGLLQVLSIGAVLFEATFVLAVLLPRVAWVYVLAGMAMHLVIFATQRAPFFTFIALYIVFLEPVRESWRVALARLGPSAPVPSAAATNAPAA